MTLREHEFRVLRETIAVRGTVRMVLVPFSLFCWALLAGGLVVFSGWPIAAVLSLAVLVGGFEAVHALHVGVERIGRYIQVFYEADPLGPRWETTAMRTGPGLPGGGVDPLFTLLFVGACLANLVVIFIPPPSPYEASALIALHVAFIVRVMRARLAAARQRVRDLETFQRLHAGDQASPTRPTV